MIQRDYLIVGAGIGGATACEALREYDPKGSVTLVGYESSLPYYRPRLPEAVWGGKLPSLDKISVHPRRWYEDHRVELRLETLITQVNLERRIAVLHTGQAIEFRKAVLAMGSRPFRPQVAGAGLGGIVYARTWRDLLALREMAVGAKRIVIVGGGLVAAELASALKAQKLPVEILSRRAHLCQRWLDPATAEWLTALYEANGVPLIHDTLNGFEGKTVLRNIQTKSGNRIATSLAVMALGTELNMGLVANTPLGSPNGTPVNELLESDEKGIYAIGDIALFPDAIFGGVRRSDDWGTTLEQARIAGANVTGRKRQRFRGFPKRTVQLMGVRLDLVGDFRQAPVRYQLEGEYAKHQFSVRYYQGQRLSGVVLVNQPETAVAAAEEAILHSYRK